MLGCLMFKNLDEIELTRVIHVIEKNGGNYRNVDMIQDITYVFFTSEYPVRQPIIMELIKNYLYLFEKMC